MNSLFVLALTVLNVFAEAPQPKTESEKQCLVDVADKIASIKSSGSCKWEVPKDVKTDRSVGREFQCSAYEKSGNLWVPRKYPYSDGQYKGTLVCGNTQNANAESYQNQKPVFAFQCQECSTMDTSNKVDADCLKSMQETDEQNCVGNPKMQYDHQRGKSTHRQTGTVIDK